VTEYLRDKRLLLLLDNFEQVLDASLFVADMLGACPHLKVLVTSREILHLRGEKEFSVPPLALPPRPPHPPTSPPPALRLSPTRREGEQLGGFEQALPLSPAWERGPGGEGDLTQYAAVQLFIARAQDAKPDFAVTNANAPAVAEICYRLDGLPLAIELAAARVKLFSPEALLARLEHRMQVLTGGPRDLPARQQTLRNTIDWSYDLLNVDEQTLFRRLGVFVGGCTLEAVEATASELRIENAELRNASHDQTFLNSQFSILNLIESLVDKSLIQQTADADDEARFVMLETIREYALERLEESGEIVELRQRHAEYFFDLVTAEEPSSRFDYREAAWYVQRANEYDNVRAALAWSHTALAGAEMELRLAAALTEFWFPQGSLNEAHTWIGRALARSEAASLFAQAKLLRAAKNLAWQEGGPAHAIVLAEQALLLWRQLGDDVQVASLLLDIGLGTRNLGDLERSRVVVMEALELFRAAGIAWGIAGALLALGDIAFDRGDYGQATALFQEGLELGRKHGNQRVISTALITLARVARADGDYARAMALCEESLARFEEQEDMFAAFALFEMGKIAIHQRDYTRAAFSFQECITRHKESQWLLQSLEGLAAVAAAQGDGERAARL
jgi:predicted ATPase